MIPLSAEYQAIRKEIVELEVTDSELQIIKSQFQDVINSKRRTSFIRNLNDLVTVLEKRGCIGENNIDAFSVIAPSVPTINEMMSRYRSTPAANHRVYSATPGDFLGSQAPPVYQYRYTSRPVNQHLASSMSGNSDMTINGNRNVLPPAVVELVVKGIGSHWKDLARELLVCEGEIDEILCRYPRSLKECAREIMNRFLDDTDPYKVRCKLISALEKCQRKDLKEHVEEILSRRPF